jgi:hypothetical protein
VTAHHSDEAGDVFLVPALAAELVWVSIGGEEPAHHASQVLIAGGLAGLLHGLDARGHCLVVHIGAGASTASPRATQSALE